MSHCKFFLSLVFSLSLSFCQEQMCALPYKVMTAQCGREITFFYHFHVLYHSIIWKLLNSIVHAVLAGTMNNAYWLYLFAYSIAWGLYVSWCVVDSITYHLLVLKIEDKYFLLPKICLSYLYLGCAWFDSWQRHLLSS